MLGLVETEEESGDMADDKRSKEEVRWLRRLTDLRLQVEKAEDEMQSLVYDLRHADDRIQSAGRERGPVSWAEIGVALGVSGEGARKRYSAWVDEEVGRRYDEMWESVVAAREEEEDE